MPTPPAAALSLRSRLALYVQRELDRLLGPIWIPAIAIALRIGLGYRIEGVEHTRAAYRRLRRETDGPLLVCANHLTMIDSALVAWALGSPASWLVHFSSLPWNAPERRNFAASLGTRVASYVMKCLPITRGGDRGEVSGVLERFKYLLARGEVVLLFPEGGRSRTGRVEIESAAQGVGRVVAAVPGCRVLCVYLRGRRQASWSTLPARGDRFDVALELLEPRSALQGMRRSRDLARQIVATLAEMERRVLDGRQ